MLVDEHSTSEPPQAQHSPVPLYLDGYISVKPHQPLVEAVFHQPNLSKTAKSNSISMIPAKPKESLCPRRDPSGTAIYTYIGVVPGRLIDRHMFQSHGVYYI